MLYQWKFWQNKIWTSKTSFGLHLAASEKKLDLIQRKVNKRPALHNLNPWTKFRGQSSTQGKNNWQSTKIQGNKTKQCTVSLKKKLCMPVSCKKKKIWYQHMLYKGKSSKFWHSKLWTSKANLELHLAANEKDLTQRIVNKTSELQSLNPWRKLLGKNTKLDKELYKEIKQDINQATSSFRKRKTI